MILIDYQAAIDRYYADFEKQGICSSEEDFDWLSKCFDEAQEIDAVPVVHGRWNLGHVDPGCCTPGGNRPWICSECGYLASWRLDRPVHNYCPNCGAKMDLEEE